MNNHLKLIEEYKRNGHHQKECFQILKIMTLLISPGSVTPQFLMKYFETVNRIVEESLRNLKSEEYKRSFKHWKFLKAVFLIHKGLMMCNPQSNEGYKYMMKSYSIFIEERKSYPMKSELGELFRSHFVSTCWRISMYLSNKGLQKELVKFSRLCLRMIRKHSTIYDCSEFNITHRYILSLTDIGNHPYLKEDQSDYHTLYSEKMFNILTTLKRMKQSAESSSTKKIIKLKNKMNELQCYNIILNILIQYGDTSFEKIIEIQIRNISKFLRHLQNDYDSSNEIKTFIINTEDMMGVLHNYLLIRARKTNQMVDYRNLLERLRKFTEKTNNRRCLSLLQTHRILLMTSGMKNKNSMTEKIKKESMKYEKLIENVYLPDRKKEVFQCLECGGTKKKLKCSRCRLFAFCSRECQIKRWKKHKKSCFDWVSDCKFFSKNFL